VICFPLHLDRKLDNDDEVVLGGRSPTVNELLIAESGDKDNVVVEDIIEGDDDDDLEDEEQKKTSSESNSKKSGRPIGSTNEYKKVKQELIACCITKDAVALDESQQVSYESGLKRLRNGTLTKIIKEIEEKNNLPKGTIQHETVRWRVKQGNLDGVHPLHISPLFLIVEYCIRLARMGSALTKEEVMQLANDLIKDTVHAKKLKEYKLNRGLSYNKDNLVGDAWYCGF
jgi:hypothetical protein